MKVVVITGSNRGIGLGLAKSFLARSCAVVVSGRSPEKSSAVAAQLAEEFPDGKIFSVPCDVTNFDQVQQLWNEAIAHFGQVDIWVNNAGISGPQKPVCEQHPEDVKAVLMTNQLGVIYGTKVAINGMIQQGFGAIYSMEGLGSDGRMQEGLTLYGMSKAGLRYFNDAMAKELKNSPILIGALQPGMVVTDFITEPYRDKPEEWQRVKKIFNIIADRVETVTPWLVDKMLSNQKSGVRFAWSNSFKIMWRFLTSPFHKRDILYDIKL